MDELTDKIFITIFYSIPVLIIVLIIAGAICRNIVGPAITDKKVLNRAIWRLQQGKYEDIRKLRWECSNKNDINVIIKLANTIQENNTRQLKNLLESHPHIHIEIMEKLYDIYLKQARKYLNSKNYGISLDWYLCAFHYKETYESCCGIGICYYQLQQFGQAKNFFQKANIFKQSFSSLYNLFLTNVHLEEHAEGLKIFKTLRQEFGEQLTQKNDILRIIPLKHLTI